MPAEPTGISEAPLPERAWILALLSLPGIGPRRLDDLRAHGTGEQIWRALLDGGATLPLSEDRRTELHRAALTIDVQALWQRHIAEGIEVLAPADERWPSRLDEDPEPPALLLARGDLAACDGPAAAIVGTRRCTSYGRSVAAQLGSELAAAGISVVSGLALGIDAAAHAGALSEPDGAPPIAVLAGGFDRPAPQANAGLYRSIVERGLALTETPTGIAPARWRFPARNRIVAALADVVIVVESAATGGSMYTVDEALRRDRVVYAVPGPIHSPVSAGTNRLIADGAMPLVDVADVLSVFGVSPRTRPERGAVTLSADAALMVNLIGFVPEMIDDLIASSGLTVGRALGAIDELLSAGVIVRSGATVHRIG